MTINRERIERAEGNVGFDLPTVYTDDDDNPLDISGFATIEWILLRESGARVVRPATAVDLTQGEFGITWQAGDLVPGEHDLDLHLVDGLGNEITLPNDFALLLVIRKKN